MCVCVHIIIYYVYLYIVKRNCLIHMYIRVYIYDYDNFAQKKNNINKSWAPGARMNFIHVLFAYPITSMVQGRKPWGDWWNKRGTLVA